MITVELSDEKNPKQVLYFNTALEAAYGDNDFRYLFYGGAIRGGKTFACLAVLVILCKLFPGSKWYVIRKSFTNIQETTLPSMNKILGKAAAVHWNRDKANYYVEFNHTGSRIFFAGEDIQRDPELNWLLGLEVNGFFLEQIEELDEKTFEMCMSRLGSWYIDPMPAPLILGSFNPTMTWVRKRIYQAWMDGTLEAPYFYLNALPDDNAWVTDDQWKAWGHMDPDLFARFIKGSWEFSKPANVFAYNFEEKFHHRDLKYDDDLPLYLSFDFNVEPITCLAAQHTLHFIHILKEFRLLNSDIDELCEHIAAEYPNAHFIVTGDATGQNRTALKKNLNYYKSIKKELGLSSLQLKVPRGNPAVKNTRVLTNSLLAKHGDYWINTLACPHLTLDLNGVVVNDKGEIVDSGDKRKTHLLDCLRYYNWTWHRDFLDKSIYQYAGND